MKKTLPALAAVFVLLSACVPSLHPLYSPETIVFREELIGVWKENPQDEESWTFTRRDEEKSYTLVIREDKRTSSFHARLVKLGEHHFLDLVADADTLKDKVGDLFGASLIPGHLTMKVKLGAKLEIQMLAPEKLDELLKASPKALAHTYIEKDYLVITASTEELQAFMKKHAESKELWGEPGVMEKMLL